MSFESSFKVLWWRLSVHHFIHVSTWAPCRRSFSLTIAFLPKFLKTEATHSLRFWKESYFNSSNVHPRMLNFLMSSFWHTQWSFHPFLTIFEDCLNLFFFFVSIFPFFCLCSLLLLRILYPCIIHAFMFVVLFYLFFSLLSWNRSLRHFPHLWLKFTTKSWDQLSLLITCISYTSSVSSIDFFV